MLERNLLHYKRIDIFQHIFIYITHKWQMLIKALIQYIKKVSVKSLINAEKINKTIYQKRENK